MRPLPAAIAKWRDANVYRIALDTGTGIELRIIDGSGTYVIAQCDDLAAAVRAIANPGSKQWRVVIPRERTYCTSDVLDCVGIAVRL